MFFLLNAFVVVVVVEVLIDVRMTDFVGGSNDFIDVVSDFVNFAIVWIDGFEATLHFVGKEAIEWLPERFAEEEHWHFWHFAFLHEDENFGENTVAEVFQSGFKLGEKVIRFAMVQTAN